MNSIMGPMNLHHHRGCQQHQQIQNARPGSAALSVNAFGPTTIGKDFVQVYQTRLKTPFSQMLSLVLYDVVSNTITSQTMATKPEIQILPVPKTLEWIYILIALAMILLAETQSVFCS